MDTCFTLPLLVVVCIGGGPDPIPMVSHLSPSVGGRDASLQLLLMIHVAFVPTLLLMYVFFFSAFFFSLTFSGPLLSLPLGDLSYQFAKPIILKINGS